MKTTMELQAEINRLRSMALDARGIIALEADEVRIPGTEKEIVDATLPSSKAKRKLERAKRFHFKAAAQRALAQARMERWEKKIRRYEKKFATEGYYEGKDAAEKMKRALGVKKDPQATMMVPKTIHPRKHKLNAVGAYCIQGYHGACQGRVPMISKGGKECACHCHKEP